MEKKSDMPPAYEGPPPSAPPGSYAPTQGYNPQYGGQYPPPGQYPQYPPQPPQGGQYGPPPPGYQYTNVVVQQPMAVPSTGPPPQDHMKSAIFVTLCCFWPTGVIAIMKAMNAKEAAARGDMLGANSHARQAQQMVRVSIGIGICCLIFSAIVIGLYIGFIVNAHSEIDDLYDDK